MATNGLMTNQRHVHTTWDTLSLWLEEELQRQRERIEGDLNPEETAKTRGRIQALKEILDLPKSAA
jgi:hypothetical protein